MSNEPEFLAAAPYQDDLLALPVTDLDAASKWYCDRFGMTEVERVDTPVATVILERDRVRLGFAINGGDASQEGAAIRVTNIARLRDVLQSSGVAVANWRVDEKDGQKQQVFFCARTGWVVFLFLRTN